MDATQELPGLKSSVKAEPGEETRMPLIDHLGDLRSCLIRSLLAFLVGFGICYNYSGVLVELLQRPLISILPPGEAKLYFTGVTDKFFVYLKVSAMAGVIVVYPYLLYQVWKFVAPGLYKHERKFLLPFLLLGTLAFVGGVGFAFFIVIPYGYEFLINFGDGSEQAIITLTEYFGLTIKMFIALGLVFELPVVMVLLGKFGIVSAPFLKKYRRHAFLGVAVLSAVITPSPDAVTMLLVMGPLWLLYEISIIGVKWVNPTGKTMGSA